MLQIHYNRVSFARPVLFLVLWLALVALVACSSGGDDPPDNGGTSSGGGNPSISSSSGGGTSSAGGGNSSGGGGTSSGGGVSSSGGGNPGSSGSVDVNVENAIKIEFKSGSAPVITNSFSEVTINPTGENVVIRIPDAPDDKEPKYNFVISGTTSNGSVKFYGNARKSLYLNGVNITNSTGPAINIQGGKRVNVHLVNGTTNFLTDGPNYSTPPTGEQAKGTFFSEGKLEFNEGNGTLEVKGKNNHAIVVDNGFEINSGKIIVKESVNDGIHVNDKIEVKGGEIDITSVGDGIQSEKKAESQNVPQVKITGGKIKILTTGNKSHGIASDSGAVSIESNAVIQINVKGDGSKGIRARGWIQFKGGNTTIETNGEADSSDSSADESNATGIKLTGDLFIDGGELTVKTTKDGAKGINTEGDATISGGKINIDAIDNGLKVQKTLKITGGTGSIKSKKKKAIDAKEWDNNEGSITIQNGVS
ncbi:MAG: carbohydrate-binding domain-containing protein [Fibromonadaceae bacterium]|jgi:hypothetical protein|nr:carbohydrate-binding domain-containing protein [Fibromonadaceae bacterium]